ncbi:uncharacterized protein VTP21DRAFT_11472 [Calcarisporiella thermophila]|uniref:uncharacterized protein n=1 Tax=Calcarisporiella thermophila TaxID=911321 RepID=UPI00374278A9
MRRSQHSHEILSFTQSMQTNAPSMRTWSNLFTALQYYVDHLQPTTLPPGSTLPTISPEDVNVLITYLKQLKDAVTENPSLRTTLHENREYNAIFNLFRLLTCAVPVELKASILDAIAAFCRPDGGVGNDISRSVWDLLEQSQIVHTTRWDAEGGICFELEEIESAKETYPETLSFVQLLNALIHTPHKKVALLAGLGVVSPSIPENLGAGTRIPGITPYINFVLDHVLAKAASRGYSDPAERWKISEASLKLVEKSLITFDLSGMMIEGVMAEAVGLSALRMDQQQQHQTQKTTVGQFGVTALSHTEALVLHPGFEIMKRLLVGQNVFEEICRIITHGVDKVNENSPPELIKSILRCLRILWRTLQIQNIFLDVLVPGIIEGPLNTQVVLPPSLGPIERLLIYRQDIVVHIARLVGCRVNDEICLLSVKILQALADSTSFVGTSKFGNDRFDRLTALLESSEYSIAILHGFMQRLEVGYGTESKADDSTEVPLILEGVQEETEEPGLTNTLRLAILGLLLRNLEGDKVPPTVSHYLLGYDLRSMTKTEIEDPTVAGGNLSCLHVILDLLRAGTDPEAETEAEGSGEGWVVPLWIEHPVLAERCYQLMYRLCCDEHTSSPTMRYLRTREDYFYRQMKMIPARLLPHSDYANGEIVGYDGTRYSAEYNAVLSQLHQRAWILKNLALELHITTSAGQRSRTQRLLDLLFSSIFEGDEDIMVADVIVGGNGNRFEQPLMKLLELLDSLDFVWHDEFALEEFQPYHFQKLNFDACLRMNERGCSVYDLRAIYALLRTAQHQLERQGNVGVNRAGVKQEMRAVLMHFVAENRQRELYHAKLHCLRAWKQVVSIAFSECFELLPPERESIICDIVGALLRRLAETDNTSQISEELSQVLSWLVYKLREDQERQSVQNAGEDIPNDRLQLIFRGIVEGIQRPHTTIATRGNLYVAMLNYLRYTGGYDDSALANAEEKTSFGKDERAGIEAANVSVINGAGERFLEVICRDASDGSDAWRTTAFIALDALCLLLHREKVNRIVTYMVRRNFLKHFIEMIKRDDTALEGVLKEYPEMMSSLYVYRAEMSLFLRIAQRKDGAEKLLSSGFIEVLTECQFLDQRPEIDVSDTGFDTFIPTSVERYHDLFEPPLQVLVALLSTMGRGNSAAVNRVVNWVGHHQEVLSAILRDKPSVVTLAQLREIRLITALFYFLSGRPDLFTRKTAGGLGVFFTLLTNLTRFFEPDQWSANLSPINAEERARSQTTAKYLGRSLNKSLFRQDADIIVRDICKNLLGFFQVMTDAGVDRSLPEFKPIFSYSLAAAHEKDIFSLSQPASISGVSLGTLVVFLRNTTDELITQINEHNELTFKQDNIGAMSLEEVNEIVSVIEDGFVDELTTMQRKHLALKILKRSIPGKAREILSTLHILEMALLLVWRHLDYYLTRYQPSSSDRPDIRLDTSMRERRTGGIEPSASDLEVLRTECGVLKPVLTKVAGLELTKEIVGLQHRSRMVFIQILTQRIKELFEY